MYTALVFCAFIVLMQPAAATETFSFQDRSFLQYYFIWNQFDSSVVMYQFGEVVVKGNTAESRVALSNLIRSGDKIQGSGRQGISTDLEALARTEDFTLPAGGTIEYYAKVESFRTPCDQFGESGGGGGNRTAELDVLDRTEFVLQLVRADDNTVLFTLDSVGVSPVGTDKQLVHYGNNLKTVKHAVAIPASFGAVRAYLRISPRRYGPTPLGLTLNKESHWVNFTALYDSTGSTMISTEQMVALRDRSFNKLLDYCDSVKSATGWLPDMSDVGFTPAQKAIFHDRYMANGIDSATGNTYVYERPAPVSAKRPATVPSGGKVYMTTPGRILEITPLPVVSDKAEAVILGLAEFPARLRLLSAEGQDLGVVWKGNIAHGTQRYPLALPAVAGGTYLLSLERDSGEVVGSISIVITR